MNVAVADWSPFVAVTLRVPGITEFAMTSAVNVPSAAARTVLCGLPAYDTTTWLSGVQPVPLTVMSVPERPDVGERATAACVGADVVGGGDSSDGTVVGGGDNSDGDVVGLGLRCGCADAETENEGTTGDRLGVAPEASGPSDGLLLLIAPTAIPSAIAVTMAITAIMGDTGWPGS